MTQWCKNVVLHKIVNKINIIIFQYLVSTWFSISAEEMERLKDNFLASFCICFVLCWPNLTSSGIVFCVHFTTKSALSSHPHYKFRKISCVWHIKFYSLWNTETSSGKPRPFLTKKILRNAFDIIYVVAHPGIKSTWKYWLIYIFCQVWTPMFEIVHAVALGSKNVDIDLVGRLSRSEGIVLVWQ